MPNVTVNLTGDEQRLLRSMQRVINKEAELAQRAQHTGKVSQTSSQQAAASLSSMAAGYLGVGAAVAVVTRALEQAEQARKRFAEGQRGAEMGMASLAQLSGGDAGKLQSLTAAARSTYAEGGAGTLDQAARTIFSLESAGALGSRDLFSKLYGIIEQPDVMARAATTLRTSMGPSTGTIRQITSKAFAASAFAPATAEALLESASRAGPSARALGIGDESVLAATSILAKATGSAEEGGTALSALLRALQRQGGFKGQGLGGALTQLQGMGLDEQQMIKYLGRAEAYRGFDILSENRAALTEVSTAVSAGARNDLTGSILSTLGAVPEVSAARDLRIAKAQEEVGATESGVRENLYEASMARTRAGLRGGGVPEPLVELFGMGASVLKYSPMHQWGVREAAVQVNPQSTQILDLLNNIEQNTRSGSTTLAKPDQDR